MKKALQKSGFKVIYGENLSRNQMFEKVDEFTDRLDYGGVGMFYYAGHGMQVDGKNYLVPIKSKIKRSKQVRREAFSANELVDLMNKSKSRMNIVVLDACRNDPFSRGGGGLAKMSPAVGTFIAYSTASGSVADDGEGKNGLFTSALIKEMQTTKNISEMLNDVSTSVYFSSNGVQIPEINSSIAGKFYFNLPSQKTEDSSETAWSYVKNSKDIALIKDFINRYPKSPHVFGAELLLKELELKAEPLNPQISNNLRTEHNFSNTNSSSQGKLEVEIVDPRQQKLDVVKGLPEDEHERNLYLHKLTLKGKGNDFVKVSQKEGVLPDSADKWDCVLDQVTGLYWEKKNTDGGPRDYRNKYGWGGVGKSSNSYGNTELGFWEGLFALDKYESLPSLHSLYKYNQYSPDRLSSDWNDLVNSANQENLCGFNDWRLPTVFELKTLNTFYSEQKGDDASQWQDNNYENRIYLNPVFFPTIRELKNTRFWTSSPYRRNSYFAWFVRFTGEKTGSNWAASTLYGDGWSDRNNQYSVRLVRNEKK